MIEQIKQWVKSFPDYKNLSKMVEAEKDKGGLKQSLLLVALSQLISFISISSAYLISSGVPGSPIAGYPASTTVVAFLKLSLVGLGLFFPVAAIFYVLARLLGGKGTFSSQCYVQSVFGLLTNIYAFPFTLFSQMPLIGVILQVAVGLIGIYGVYAQYQTLKTIHQLSMVRTAVVIIGTWLLLFLLATLALRVTGGAMLMPTTA